MKSKLWVGVVVAAMMGAGAQIANAASTYDTAVEAQNPLAYYNLDSSSSTTTTDAVNGYTMTLNNGASVVAGTGPTIDGAAVPSLVLANGASGTEYAGSGGSDPEVGGVSNAGTVLAWINLAALPSTDGRTFSIAGSSAYGDDLDLQINGDNRLSFYTDSGGAVQDPNVFDSSNLNQWIFVAASFTANTDRTLYIDGTAVAANVPGGHSDSNNPFYIGQSNVFGGRYFDGSIADVAFYDTDLSAAQIEAIYAAASVVPVSGAPEPSTWALMTLGVGAIGYSLRRRKRGSALAATGAALA